MKYHPRIRGGWTVRGLSLIFGLFLFAVGVVLIYESKLGLSPWDVLNQGLAKHTFLSFEKLQQSMESHAKPLGVLFVPPIASKWHD